jgi:hypothetical protein
MASFFETVTAAINDTMEFGFESEERLQYWVDALTEAALADMIPEAELDVQLRRVLGATYQRLVDKGSILQYHPGVDAFTLERIRPQLRAELDRRILASAALIKLNREQAIAETIRRFQGWATSIPAGGTDVGDRRGTKDDIRKSLAQLSFVERRVAIDQGHKLNAAISDIIADDQGAIAAEWRSHWKQANYNFRPEHKERDRVIYATRDSWAIKRRFIKAGPQGYYEDHERPGELVFCRCYVRWIYNLRDLPADMLTEAGREALAAVRVKATAA